MFQYVVCDDSKVVPSLMKSGLSQTKTITCHTVYNNAKWFFNRRKLPRNAIAVGTNRATLRITNIQLHNGGYYNCYGSNSNNETFLATSHVVIYGEVLSKH